MMPVEVLSTPSFHPGLPNLICASSVFSRNLEYYTLLALLLSVSSLFEWAAGNIWPEWTHWRVYWLVGCGGCGRGRHFTSLLPLIEEQQRLAEDHFSFHLYGTASRRLCCHFFAVTLSAELSVCGLCVWSLDRSLLPANCQLFPSQKTGKQTGLLLTSSLPPA